jgi:hypothetical protein
MSQTSPFYFSFFIEYENYAQQEEWEEGGGDGCTGGVGKGGRIVSSFRTVLAMEKEEWKPFRNALDKSDRKKFDERWDLPKWYISACSNSVQYVRLHPILISILLHDFKELTKSTEG